MPAQKSGSGKSQRWTMRNGLPAAWEGNGQRLHLPWCRGHNGRCRRTPANASGSHSQPALSLTRAVSKCIQLPQALLVPSTPKRALPSPKPPCSRMDPSQRPAPRPTTRPACSNAAALRWLYSAASRPIQVAAPLGHRQNQSSPESRTSLFVELVSRWWVCSWEASSWIRLGETSAATVEIDS